MDFVERHEIKNIGFGRFPLKFITQNFSKEISIRRIRPFSGKAVSRTTVFLNLKRRQNENSLPEIFYFKDHQQHPFQRRRNF